MTHLWRNSFWGRHALLYHLYLVVLKDNYYRARRAGRWSRVQVRLAVRWVVRYFTGRRWLVPQVVNAKKFYSEMIDRQLAQRRFLMARERDNRSLLTGMTVALVAGHGLYFTGWQRYKFANQRRSFAKGVPMKIVGKPVVYLDRLKNKLGVTEWSQDYTPRAEYLATRKRLHKGAA